MTTESAKEFKPIEVPLKLDFGCGPNKKEGFKGVDSISFPNVDYLLDIKKDKWPWENESVDEAHASHFLEHLTAQERVYFINEVYRVLKPEARITIIVPHWASQRAYGDPTHQWPPVSEFWIYYLSKEWRKNNAPHTDIEFNPNGFNCNFETLGGYSYRQDLLVKNPEYIAFAQANYKEVCQDLILYLTKK